VQAWRNRSELLHLSYDELQDFPSSEVDIKRVQQKTSDLGEAALQDFP